MVFERDVFIKRLPPGPPDFSVRKPSAPETTYSLLPLFGNFLDAPPFHPLSLHSPKSCPSRFGRVWEKLAASLAQGTIPNWASLVYRWAVGIIQWHA